MVYVVACGSNPIYFKVGYVKENFRSRLSKLQTGCPFNLVPILILPGGKELERELHEKLSRFSQRGEWFKCNNESLSILGIKENQWIREENYPDSDCMKTIYPVDADSFY